ncbi:MAG: hypothetical protein E7510_01315 [Ruminococcus sp.]|nr:hypothetical protein [Ruminococcus sp.]
MKKFKSLLAVLSAVAILSAGSFNVLQVNAEAKVLGVDADGNEILGGIYDELVGFDEEGNPIIEDMTPEGVTLIPADAILPTPDDIINDKEISDSFEPFKFIYELLDVVNAYLKDNKDLDWRTVGDKLNLDDPAKSKVEIIAGNEESAKAIESYIESQGYSKDLLEISVDPDFVIQPDILLPLIPDYNGDNVTDLTDLTALSLYLIGDAEWNDNQIINFDCNADGKTNIADLAHLKQYIMCEDVKLG